MSCSLFLFKYILMAEDICFSFFASSNFLLLVTALEEAHKFCEDVDIDSLAKSLT